MLEQDWRTYLASEEPGYFQICLLDPELSAHLRANTLAVLIDRTYVEKIFQKHNIAVEDLPFIQMAIQQGVAIQDDDRHITFFYRNPEKQHFKASIKVTASQEEILLCTFHKIRIQEFERKIRQLKDKPLLRLHK
jgi:hypothetical protein